MENIIAFAPQYNTGTTKDATGAFIPEAKKFLAHHKQDPSRLVLIDNSKSKAAQRAAVYAALEGRSGLTCVAFFCHGLEYSIQFGINKADVGELGKRIAIVSEDNVSVPLYACSTADSRSKASDGDGGFADLLRDALCWSGAVRAVVDAHTTAGHTTYNPYVRRFEGLGNPYGGVGGHMIVPPSSRYWGAWRKALKEGDLRFRFPFMESQEVVAEIAGQ